jgi:hypothetical protein
MAVRDPSRWPRGTLYPQKLALSSPTSGGRSVGIVRSRTQATAFYQVLKLSTTGEYSGDLILPLGQDAQCRAITQLPLLCRSVHSWLEESGAVMRQSLPMDRDNASLRGSSTCQATGVAEHRRIGLTSLEGCHKPTGFQSRNSKLVKTVYTQYYYNSVAWVCERTIPTERPRLVGEPSANYWG